MDFKVFRRLHDTLNVCLRLVQKHKIVSTLFAGIVLGISISHVYLLKTDYDSSNANKRRSHYYYDKGGDVPIYSLRISEHLPNVSSRIHEGLLLAGELKKKIRVICWIMTSPKNHLKKAMHVKATWGTRCDRLLFMSSKHNPSLPSIALPVKEGRNHLWGKTKEAFKYIHKHYDDYDYVLKADDDTFVVVENLKFMLFAYDPRDPIYLGCKLKPYIQQGYMSGGAGYLLSKESVKRFVEMAIPHRKCRQDHGGSEDVNMGKCLQLVGVKAEDSRDGIGRQRFFPYQPGKLLMQADSKSHWYRQYMYYPDEEDMDCYSDLLVSFHKIVPAQMYVLEYLIYRVRAYGEYHDVDRPTLNAYFLAEATTTIREDRRRPNGTDQVRGGESSPRGPVV